MALLLSDFLLAFVFLITGVYLWIKFSKQRKDLPPGVSLYALLANLRDVGRFPYVVFKKWSKVYGPIFRLKVGTMEQIIISDYKIHRELFSDYAATGRLLDNPLIHELGRGCYGVLNAEGPTWEEQRRFTLRTLRNFGFAKSSMETLILEETRAMIKWFRKSGKKPITGNRIFNAPVVNSLWHIVTGERWEWEEGNSKIIDCANAFFEAAINLTASGILFIPALRYIAPEYFGWNRFKTSIDQMHNLVNEAINRHKETFQEDNLRDFIDCFLLEMKNSNDASSSFYAENGYKNLSAEIFDMFLAGSETTANTSAWMFLYLSAYPEIQEKVYQEICKVVGSRTPSLADRPQMPYAEAFLMELLRMTAVAPLGVPHRMLEDKLFQGYFLPKEIGVFVNIYAIHHDPEVWEDPESFKPERFLSADGSKVERNDALVPFGDGKRRCLGETLAKDTLFLFLVNFVQHFKILPAGDAKPDFQSAPGFAHVPKPFEIVMSPRPQIL